MKGYRRLSYDDRLKVTFMVDRGDSYSKIANEIATTPGAFSKIIKKILGKWECGRYVEEWSAKEDNRL